MSHLTLTRGRPRTINSKNRDSRAESSVCECGHSVDDHFRGVGCCRGRGKRKGRSCSCATMRSEKAPALELIVLGLPQILVKEL
jgi:hypothetical protein